MSKTGRSLTIALLSMSFLTAGFVEAARLGGGRSTGMQRSQVTRSAPPRQAAPQAPVQQAPQQAQPQRSGPGWGGVAAGAAAGAVGGYMLGQAMSDKPGQGAPQASATAPFERQQSSTPWGWILLLGGLGVLGAMFFLRRNAQPARGPAYAAPAGANAGQDRKVFRMGEGMSAAPAAAITRLPDGTEAAAFLRQARASFAHIQSLNSPEQLEEVRRYLTPQLFDELKLEISANREVAEFSDLNLDLLAAEQDGEQMVASVRFSGRVSESLHAPAVPFAEIWHFVRPVVGDPRWVLAGIQQE